MFTTDAEFNGLTSKIHRNKIYITFIAKQKYNFYTLHAHG